MTFRYPILVVFLFMLLHNVYSQIEYAWWNEAQNWDGITPWDQYITTASGHMGPNAVPVPQIKQGNVTKELKLEYGIFTHINAGDHTQNVVTKIYIPLAKNKAALEIYGVPVEYFKMNTQTRDARGCRDFDGEGFAGGDLYFSTIIQISNEQKRFLDMAFSLNCKTASGNNFRNARFTDTPGYFFDLSFGKNISQREDNANSIRLYSMAGFYSYQTYIEKHRQEDALLYGLGTKFSFTKYTVDNAIGGYYGYLGNGDRPIVYRFNITKLSKHLNIRLSYQLGLKDLDYHSIGLTMISHFNKPSNY